MVDAATREFLEAKRIALAARAQRLSRLSARRVGLRPQDIPFAPSAEHFRAANRRLAADVEKFAAGTVLTPGVAAGYGKRAGQNPDSPCVLREHETEV